MNALEKNSKVAGKSWADIANSADTWKDFFETLMSQMVEYEMGRESCIKQVSLCSELADLALNEYERRWAK